MRAFGVRSPRVLIVVLECALWMGLLFSHVQHVRSHGGNLQITHILPKRQKVCFSEVWTESDKVFFEYQVLRGGSKDVHVTIITPNGMVMYEKQWATRDIVTFTPQNGEFRFCFDNEYSMIYEKVLTFNIRSAFTKTLAEEAGDKVPTVHLSTHMSCDVIHEAVSATLDFQRRFRVRESIGRHRAEVLNKMVTWWSSVQSVVVLVVGLGQVLVLRFLFTHRRPSSKPAEDEPEEQHPPGYPRVKPLPIPKSEPKNLFL